MKHLTIALVLGVLLTGFAPNTAQAQKRKRSPRNKTTSITTLPTALPIYATTEYHTDTTWMLPKGEAFELDIALQLPACDACPTYHAIREWYKTHYAHLANEPQHANAQLERFALDATPQQPTPVTNTITSKKKKRKSRKERKAEAERLAAMTITNKTPRHSLDLTLERLFENSYITTYRLNILHYTPQGGGQEKQHYITINKATGKPLLWENLYLPKQKRKFVMAIANGLQRHFHTSDWKNLLPLLNNSTLKPSTLPLPLATPIIVEGSLYAIYTANEITPTTTEAPILIIDAQWLKGTLTPTANHYFK